MTKKQAKEFMRDVKGTLMGNADRPTNTYFEIGFIADKMNISVSKAKQFLYVAQRYGYTYTDGKGWVV